MSLKLLYMFKGTASPEFVLWFSHKSVFSPFLTVGFPSYLFAGVVCYCMKKLFQVSSNIVRNLMRYSYNFRSFPGVDEVALVLATAYHHLQCNSQQKKKTKLCVLVLSP